VAHAEALIVSGLRISSAPGGSGAEIGGVQ